MVLWNLYLKMNNFFFILIIGFLIWLKLGERISSLYFLWLIFFILGGLKLKSRFIRLLLLLEVIIIGILCIICVLVRILGLRIRLMYLVMVFRVGEAVFGLRILVNLRRISSEQVLRIYCWENSLRRI